MTQFKPYKSKKPRQVEKRPSISAETRYGSPEHAKWLYEKNMHLLSSELIKEIEQVHDSKSAQALMTKILGPGPGAEAD